MWVWLCEGKLKLKIAHFRLPSASQKCACLSSLIFLLDRWITSETFHDVQNANSRCTGHATMSTERGNYLLITVRAPFLAIDRAKPKNPFAIVVWKLLVTERGMENSGDVLHGILLKNTVPTRVKHCAFIALQKFYSDHCLKRFCEFPGIFRFRFFSKKTNPHSLQQSS